MYHPLFKILDRQKLTESRFNKSYHVIFKGDTLPFPWTQTEIIGDGMRLLLEPNSMELNSEKLVLFPVGETAPGIVAIYPKEGRSWKHSLTIRDSARDELKALAAAAAYLGTVSKVNGKKVVTPAPVRFEQDENRVVFAYVKSIRMATTMDMSDDAEKIAFNPQYLLDSLSPRGNTVINYDSSTYPAMIRDVDSNEWRIILMPTTHL